MKEKFKQIILKLFGKKVINLIKVVYFFLDININFNCKYLSKYNFINISNIYKVNQNLILISQIQRSGGTLLTQLFDNHPELYSYPNELILTKPKWDWSKKFNFITYSSDLLLKQSIIDKNYRKVSVSALNKYIKNYFNFDPFSQKKIFNLYEKKTLRDYFDAYFTSFFNSFKNYENLKGKKKYITAFLPRFIFFNHNLELFFKIYNNSYIISIIRDPLEWLLSAQVHQQAYKEYGDINNYTLSLWLKNINQTFIALNNYKKQIILIRFDELILNTEKTLKKISKIININFDEHMLKPTFNGEAIESDSSFKSVQGFVDRSVIKKKNDLVNKFPNVDKELLNECYRLYEKTHSYTQINNL